MFLPVAPARRTAATSQPRHTAQPRSCSTARSMSTVTTPACSTATVAALAQSTVTPSQHRCCRYSQDVIAAPLSHGLEAHRAAVRRASQHRMEARRCCSRRASQHPSPHRCVVEACRRRGHRASQHRRVVSNLASSQLQRPCNIESQQHGPSKQLQRPHSVAARRTNFDSLAASG